MRGIIIVETQKEYNAWMIKQRPEYRSAMAAVNSAASDQTLALEANQDKKTN
jgi:heme/copper-type cytochrome/quinol oxidase subunit 2